MTPWAAPAPTLAPASPADRVRALALLERVATLTRLGPIDRPGIGRRGATLAWLDELGAFLAAEFAWLEGAINGDLGHGMTLSQVRVLAREALLALPDAQAEITSSLGIWPAANRLGRALRYFAEVQSLALTGHHIEDDGPAAVH